jgi:hypothetical protein
MDEKGDGRKLVVGDPAGCFSCIPGKPLRLRADPLFEHLVGAHQERLGDSQTDRLGSLEIDDQPELRRLLDRQIGRLRALDGNLSGGFFDSR